MCKKFPRYLPFTLIVIFAALIMLHLPCQAAEPDLIITGTGVYEEVVIYPGDWSGYTQVVRTYSTNNNFDYHKIWKVKGYDLFEIIGVDNLKSQKYTVTFIARDKAKLSKTIGELKSQFYYKEFSGKGSPVAPTIGFYKAVLFDPDYQGKPDPADIIWQNRELTEADWDHEESPRLYYGQTSGQYSENNQSFFLKNLVRIVVGEERPDNSGNGQTTDPNTGEGTTVKPGAEEETEEQVDSNGKNNEVTVSPKENTGENDAGEDGDGDDENGTDVTAPGSEGEKRPDTGEAAGERTRKPRRPWIAAGAVVVVSAGGGIYYYIRRRKA